MKTLIAIPCMDMVPVPFMQSLLYLDKSGDVSISMVSGSLVYDSRNDLLEQAIESGCDRMLWLDSDMVIPEDTMTKLSKDLDAGYDIVSALYIRRRDPFTPVIFRECHMKEENGLKYPIASAYLDYPDGQIFEVEAFGFGCVMMSLEAVKGITRQYGSKLFMPVAGFGEDLSFCLRAQSAGAKLYCDSNIKVGHVGYKTFTEEDWRKTL